jgi:hypothetical protein
MILVNKIYYKRFVAILQRATFGTVAEPEEKLSAAGGGVVQLYRTPGMSESQRKTMLKKAQSKVNTSIYHVDSELCFNVSLDGPLSHDEARTLSWYDLTCLLLVWTGWYLPKSFGDH